ncbi:TIGR03936 family radical SAM-associated protein [Clostridium ganghwense]|uniref:TIGR03936 family radical SAM-associated protein n=1 Tax=Clostridium ganghwense TaxID=312089 RepID=A0ABT4CUY5_9CLOT|nr:TIGR03936 family radical SAM-associated protein [Clostridium ganghwense]MCY6371866.1 TIGR03936 family radical SAM-associated protein [Clostridium ganghwense]
MKMRYLIKYTKEDNIKYVSHLELMRTIQRMIRRSELPVEYSKGFNPHIILSIAQPLSVGVYSKGEYMDLIFSKESDPNYIKEQLNMNSPMGIKIVDVIKVREKIGDKKAPQAMAAIEAAEYNMKLKCIYPQNIEKELKELMTHEEWNTIKRSKKGSKEVNIKPLIKKFNYKVNESILEINTLVTCGSKGNLSAQLLGEYIKEKIQGIDKEAFIHIERQDMFAYMEKKLLPLNQYLK